MHTHSHKHSTGQTAPETEGITIRWARHYDFIFKLLTLGKENNVRKETIRQAAIPVGATVLDVGCGTGTLTLLAKGQAGAHGRVYGIDAAPEMIQAAQRKAQEQNRVVDFQTGVIEALPYSDGRFDVVLSSLMFHHLPADLKRRGLEEMYRVLKPGGRVLIVDLHRPTSFVQRMSMLSMVHHGLAADVFDLAPPMEKIGYTDVQTACLSWRLVGYIQGKRS